MSTAFKLGDTNSMPELSAADLEYFSELIEDLAGIHIKPAKQELIRTRLRSRIQAHSLKDFAEYRKLLSHIPSHDPEWQIFTNLLTTNKTDFFREPKHFHFLVHQILPEWLKTSETTFKVWSAACSTGEEPYTLAMVLARYLPRDRNFKIIASDIDTQVLQKAKNAVYPLAKLAEIPDDYQHFGVDVGRGEVKDWFRIKPKLHERVEFQQHNLTESGRLEDNAFHLVLCRNVFIYFHPDTIQFVQNKLFKTVKRNGHLFIGHSESLHNAKHQWAVIAPSVFKKN